MDEYIRFSFAADIEDKVENDKKTSIRTEEHAVAH